MRGRYTVVSLAIALSACARPQADTQPALITVDVSRVLGPVKPMVFGHSLEAADPYLIFGSNHNYSDTRTGEGFWNPDKASPVPASVAVAKSVRTGLLRYPGGCLVHGFRWKEFVGPVSTRPNHAFGVDEYLALCKAIGCEPLMNVSDYSCSPGEAAELVEYLNAPADGLHPWAKKRALWGHPKPYGVRFFEMGNESDHGNHDLLPKQKWTALEYATWFEKARGLMKAIDPKIRMGALMGTGTGPSDPWNVTVLKASNPDFIVIHTYSVNVWSPDKPVAEPEDLIMRGCLAAVDQTTQMVSQYRALVKSVKGRDIPLAITEYNTGLVQEQPKPYRFSFGAALFSANYMGQLLQPDSGVEMANYWHLLNGYWGMVQNGVQHPAYALYRLWGQHTGSQLVAASVTGPTVSFEGFPGHMKPSEGKTYQAEASYGPSRPVAQSDLRSQSADTYSVSVTPAEVVARLSKATGEQYPVLAELKGQAGASYVVSFEARSEGLTGSTMGLSVIDGRGWEPYHSGMAIEGLENASDWRLFSGRFDSRPDCRGVLLAWRFLPKQQTVSGTIEVRNIRVQTIRPERFASYPALTVTASTTNGGKKLYLMITNRDPRRRVPATIRLMGWSGTKAKWWQVSAPDLSATSVTETEGRLILNHGNLVYTFPAGSLTAFEVTR